MNGTFPKLWPNAWLTACSALALAVGGCGGDGGHGSKAPRIEPSAATELASRSDEIARLLDEGDVCGAAQEADDLRAKAQAEIDDGSVPRAFAAELVAKADGLVNEVNCEPDLLPPPSPTQEDDEGKSKDKKKQEEGDG